MRIFSDHNRQNHKQRQNRRNGCRRVAGLLLGAMLLSLISGGSLGVTGFAAKQTVRILDCSYEPGQGEECAGFCVHEHTEDCFDESGRLICPLPEIPYHIHDSGCYRIEEKLICGKEEKSGHVHTGACYEIRRILTCEQKETILHRHDDNCYSTDENGKRILTCGMLELEEHVHNDTCFRLAEVLEDGRIPLSAPEEENEGEEPDVEEPMDNEPSEAETDGEESVGEETTEKEPDAEEQVDDEHSEEINEEEASEKESAAEGETETTPEFAAGVTHDDADAPEGIPADGGQPAPMPGQENSASGETVTQTESETVQNGTRPQSIAEADTSTEQNNPPETEQDNGFVFLFPEEETEETQTVEGEETQTVEGEETEGGSFVFLFDDPEESSTPVEGEVTTAEPESELEVGGEVAEETELTPGEETAVETSLSEEMENEAEDTEETDEEEKPEDTEVVENAETPDASENAEDEKTETVPDEQQETPEAAMAFEETVGSLQVRIQAPDGAFPEGTTVRVTAIEDEDVLSLVTRPVEGEILQVMAVDISFFDAEGNEIEPALPIQVEMIPVENPENTEPTASAPEQAQIQTVVHLDGEGNTTVVEQKEAEPTETGAADFSADSFSVYALIYSVIEKTVLASDGGTYRITVNYTAEAEIPQDAYLAVEEILEEDERYEAHVLETAEAVGSTPEWLTHVRMFDIQILNSAGEKVEPAVPVQVHITYVDPVEINSEQPIQVVHFGEEGTEVLEPETNRSEDGSVDEFRFETGSFSIYTIVSFGATGDLDGKTYALVSWLGGREIGAGLIGQAHEKQAGRLKATSVVLTTLVNTYLSADEDLTFWTFTETAPGKYTLRDEEGGYLNIDEKQISVSENPQELVLETRAGFPDQIHLSDGKKRSLNLYNWKIADGFGVWQDYGANEWFTLYELGQLDLSEKKTAEKISVQDLEDADSVIVYLRKWNETTEEYDLYAIDGNGDLVYLFEKGDTFTWRSSVSLDWKVIMHRDAATYELNGYYDFYNEETGKFLAPQSTGILADNRLGVTLSGRSQGQYSSPIEGWDDGAYAWYGYQVADRILLPGIGEESAAFSFGRNIRMEPGELHGVETVDSAAAGIRIGMYNFASRDQMAAVIGNNDYTKGNVNHLVENRLGADGFPQAKNGRSLGALFKEENFIGNGNHLFLKSVFDATGYYEYNCFDNFAYYNKEDGSFSVYRELGTPSNENQFYYKRGNFFPYNHLDLTRPATNYNQYKGSGTELTELDPAKGEQLYLFQEANDFFFGMTVEANVLQARGGRSPDGSPIIYEFNGDDDLWIFIDNTLVLDIGGIHDAIPGTINFATGEVNSGNSSTTIRKMFEAAGQSTDDFRGETFADYSSHTMKMFYMERGAGASNLEIRFNLPVVEKGTFAVEKQLKGTNQQDYSSVRFAYQAFLIDPDAPEDRTRDIPLRGDVPQAEITGTAPQVGMVLYEGTDAAVAFHDGVRIGEGIYNNVFYLRPGQAAVFHGIREDMEYYVQEINVSGDYYDTVLINDAGLGADHDEALKQGGAITATSSAKTIIQRQRVLFENQCSPKNIRSLKITKHVDNPDPGDPTFEFRVSLEKADGTLGPYEKGNYYVMDADGNYYYYADGTLTSNGSGEENKVVCSKSGYNGSIAGIPDGFTVVIEGLLAGTDFLVEEIRIPDGFEMTGKELTAGTFDGAETPGADGQIRLGVDAEVRIINHHYSYIKAVKEWEHGDYPVDKHGDIRLALYTVDGNGENLVEGSVRTIAWPSVSTIWNIDLEPGESLSNYSVYEVIEDENGVTPLTEPYTPIRVAEERMSGQNVADTVNTYLFAGCVAGEERTVLSNGTLYIQTREDSVRNVMPSLTVNKNDSDESALAGAEFRLLRATDGGDMAVAGYETIISTGEKSGNLLKNIRLPDGIYYLEETKAPEGYQIMAKRIRISVGAGEIEAAFEDGSALKDETPKDPTNATYSLTNYRGVEMPETGGHGTNFHVILGLLFCLAAGAVLLLRRSGEIRL